MQNKTAIIQKINNIFSKPLFFLFLFFILMAFKLNFSVTAEQQYAYLADSFLQGKLYFLEKPLTWTDCAPFNNHYYWPDGPFPALLLVPFVFIFNLFKLTFLQGYLSFFLLLFTLLLIFLIAKKFSNSKNDAALWAYAFCFSSVYLSMALLSWSWFYSQQLVVFLIFLAIYEYLNKKRWGLIGMLFGFIFLSRPTAGLGITFFMLDILFSSKIFKEKIKSLTLLLFPFIILIFLFLPYNYFRYGNILETGHSYQLQINPILEKNREAGIISLKHLPGNLYYFFLNPLKPIFYEGSKMLRPPFLIADPWGTSIFITSPYFIYLFFLKYKDRLSKFLWASIILTALPIFLFFGIGFRQSGYRYALDFMPFLFFLLMKNYSEQIGSISKGLKIIIILSSFINLYLFFTVF